MRAVKNVSCETPGSTAEDVPPWKPVAAYIPKSVRAARTPPRATRATPIARGIAAVRGPAFSTKIARDSPPIQRRLIEPATNRTSMNSQQQPMQYAAWRRPIRNAPARPLRQWSITKPIGDWQWVRHTSFARVTWYAPAAIRTPAGRKTSGPIIGPMRPRVPIPTSARRLNPPQTRKYGATKSAVATRSAGFPGPPAFRPVRPSNVRIIGRAAGSIIATIITTRIRKNRARPAVPTGPTGVAVRAIERSDVDHVTYHAAATTRDTATATGSVSCRRRFGSCSDVPPAIL